MTIKQTIDTLSNIEKKTKEDNIRTKVKSCIDTLKRFKDAPQNKDGAAYIVPNEVEKAVKNMDSSFSPTDIDINWADRLLNAVNEMTKPPKEQESEGKTKHRVLKILIDWIPVILGLLVSGIALSLGLTIFNDNQDATYFIAETIKDVLVGLTTSVGVNQCMVSYRKTEKTSYLTLIGGVIFGIFAFAFSLILWILSNYAFVERFTQWDKTTYIWICCGIILVSIISIAMIISMVIAMVLSSSKQKKETESKQ